MNRDEGSYTPSHADFLPCRTTAVERTGSRIKQANSDEGLGQRSKHPGKHHRVVLVVIFI